MGGERRQADGMEQDAAPSEALTGETRTAEAPSPDTPDAIAADTSAAPNSDPRSEPQSPPSWIVGAPSGRDFSDRVARATRGGVPCSALPRLRARADELSHEQPAPAGADGSEAHATAPSPGATAPWPSVLGERPAPSVLYAGLAMFGAVAALAAVVANAPPDMHLAPANERPSLEQPLMEAPAQDRPASAPVRRSSDQSGYETADTALANRRVAENTPLRFAAIVDPGAVEMARVAWLALSGGDCLQRRGSADACDAAAQAQPRPAGAYLSGRELGELMSRRARKCILAPEGGCAETTIYQPDTAFFLRRSQLENGDSLEVMADYALEDDALCHYTPGLSALVTGRTARDPRSLDLSRRIEAHYHAAARVKICHRLRRAGMRDGHELYVADVFVDDAPTPQRTDPRRFEISPTL